MRYFEYIYIYIYSTGHLMSESGSKAKQTILGKSTLTGNKTRKINQLLSDRNKSKRIYSKQAHLHEGLAKRHPKKTTAHRSTMIGLD
jgi:hypothetical protein